MVLSSLLPGGTSSPNIVEQVQILILLLIVTLIVALLSRRLRVPYTLLLVIVGLVIGLLPFLPYGHLDPNLILYVFIPALLFEGAWHNNSVTSVVTTPHGSEPVFYTHFTRC